MMDKINKFLIEATSLFYYIGVEHPCSLRGREWEKLDLLILQA